MLINMQLFLRRRDRLSGVKHGTVVDNVDPEMHGGIKVEIPNILEGSVDSLPWVMPKMSPFLGGSADAQIFAIPNVGSHVTLEAEDPYTWYYTGWTPSLATQNPDLIKDYPNTYGFIDEQGTGLTINRTTQGLLLSHVSGSTIELNKSGDMIINNPRDLTWQVGRDFILQVANEFKLDSKTTNMKSKIYNNTSTSATTIKSSGPTTIKGAPILNN